MKKKAHELELILPPSNAHLRAIGLVAVQWGYLEGNIDECIAALLRNPKAAGIEVNFMMQFAKRAREWRRLAKIVYGEGPVLTEIIDISSRAKAIKPERDKIVHGQYGGSGDPLNLLVYRSANLVELRDISLYEIKVTASIISRINRDIFYHRYLSGYGVQPPPKIDAESTRQAQSHFRPFPAKRGKIGRQP